MTTATTSQTGREQGVAEPAGPADGRAAGARAASFVHAATVGLIGLVCGSAWAMNLLAETDKAHIPGAVFLTMVAVGAFGGLLTVWLLHRSTLRAVASLPPAARARFLQYDLATYSPALLMLLGAVGMHANVLLVVLAIIAGKSALLCGVMPAEQRRGIFASMGWLSFLFLISGFAALIYQIVWQRTLYAAFGVNVESITIIVSLFMFGLGLGSLVGGLAARRFPGSAPRLFFACEAGIGLFGAVSLPLIGWVSQQTLHGPLWQVTLAIFALLCVPTMLMGATLPILVGHLYRHYRNVGKSVGMLYCINTVGSAIACLLTADLLFVLLGQQSAVLVAAACNLTVGLLVWRYARRIASQAGSAVGGPSPRDEGTDSFDSRPSTLDLRPSTLDPCPTPSGSQGGKGSLVHRWFVVLFCAATGYISLSQEIVWMRVVSYMTGGRPAVFAHVLGFFLVGVALGAYYAERVCERRFAAPGGRASPVRFVAVMLLLSAGFYYGSILLTARVHAWSDILGLQLAHVVVAAVSFLLGGIFPVLCHYGARVGRQGQDVGLAVSRLYVANIVGSTLGPLVTGFVLMEYLSTSTIVLALSGATLLLGGAAFLFEPPAPASRTRWAGRLIPLAGAVALVAVAGVGHGRLSAGLMEGLQFRQWSDQAAPPYKRLHENRHGIVAVVADPAYGDIILGGAVYDGRFNCDPTLDSNGISRCFMLAALHPDPQDVLEIGMSGASWTRVMAGYRRIQRLAVVEINPGYTAVIADYPEQASALADPKVTIHIDDGRRWLNRHPDARFDVIVQNTIFHWRSLSTALLSSDYFRLCKQRLKPGGVVYVNTTDSDDVACTIRRVFKHVVRYHSFVAASDQPFDLPPGRVRANLLEFYDWKGGQVFAEAGPRGGQLDRLAGERLAEIDRELVDKPWLAEVTDDNMFDEFKRASWQSPAWTWARLVGRVRWGG